MTRIPLRIALVIISASVLLHANLAIAKNNVTVKMSPEYTRHKKASGKNDAATTSRDASSGQATGKRIYKPVKAVQSPKTKLTPEKVEAGHENIRR